MEFTSLQIAKLVLGYLKKENCQAAVLAFCDASPHLKHFSEMIKNKKKYFITRVSGLSLVDYITEYAVIYTLIQERLEDTDYFEENRSKNLVDQLRYLLDKNGRQNRENTPARSRSSTPMKEQNKEHERLHFPKNLSIIEEVPSCNATPLQALPGNSNNDLPDKCPKTSSPSRSRKSDENGASDSEDNPDKSLEEDDLSLQVLTQTLLEHHELHEKIAENINWVRSTTEVAATIISSTEERISSGVLQELDSAIKAIVRKTEADPIFEKLIGEIIGNVGETTDEEQTDAIVNNKNTEIAKSVHIQESDSTPVLESEENLVKQRLRSSKKQSPEKHIAVEQSLNSFVPEDPNVIQSNSSVEVNDNLATKVNVQQNLAVNTATGEIILYDGTLDNFMKTSTAGVSHTSNPLVYNNGLLMVQPSVPALMPAVSTLQVNPNKPCYMWNGSQLVNVSVPQLKVNNLTEQDILTMPTVIVCDDNQQGIINNLVVPTSTNQQRPTVTTQKKFVNIAPRLDKTADKAENISEFLTLYQCNDSSDGFAPQKIQNSKPRVKSKKKSKKSCQSTTIPVCIEVLKPTEGIPFNEIKVETENCAPISPKHESKQAVSEADSNVNGSKTPELLKKNSERQRNLSTPKSGSLSHVRALDFNFGTPGKPGKETASPKSAKKSPKKSSKVATTKISKSLFGTPTKNQKASSANSVVEGERDKNSDEGDRDKNSDEGDRDKNSDEVDNKIAHEDRTENLDVTEDVNKAEIKKASNSWDSDLRALAGPVADRCRTPKRKRKDSLRNRKPVKRMKIDEGAEMERAQPSTSTDKNNDSAKSSKDKLKRKQKIAVKDATTPNKIIKRKLPSTTEKPDKIIKLEEEETKVTKTEEVAEAPADVTCVKESETSDIPIASDRPFSLINCNAKARYKKKCNIDNNLKKEVKITKVKEIKSLEFVNDGSNKLILSPSKLNANKRTLVEVDEKDTKPQCASEREIKKSMDDLVVIEQHMLKLESQEEKVVQNNPKFLTPEMQSDPLIQQPVITSKRNLTPMLETPMKMIVSQCPKTPGLLSPVSNTDTPFTKVFKEQLQGVDISCIQTPKFPLTPNFPFTPTTDGISPYPIRPSDYSTSSSYYQPSDAEQNKSLEQLMIDECRRLENKKDTPVKLNVKEELLEVTEKEIQGIPKEITEIEQDLTNKAIAEKMKSLSSNIIARKNLNLMDRTNLKSDDSSCNSSSSDDVSETSSSDIESDDNMWNFSNNATVIQRNKCDSTKSSRYNLRSRKGDVSKVRKESPDVTAEAKKSSKIIQQIISEVEIKPTLESSVKVSTLSNHQEKVLQEMEEKRQRMIAKLKDDQNVTINVKASTSTIERKKKKLKSNENTTKVIKKSVLPSREVNGRFIKMSGSVSKDKPKPSVTKSVNRRKSNLPKKILSKENAVKTENHPHEELFKEVEGVKLHLSSDSEGTKLEPFDLVETELREGSTSSTPLPICNIPESHPLKNFHKVLESITTNQNEKNKESNSDQAFGSITTTNQNEKNKESNSDQAFGSITTNQNEKPKESNSDQEAESLVKGLKEWGIHLIHNKSPKKQGNGVLMNKINSNGKNHVTLQVASKSESENENIKNDAGLQAIPKTDGSGGPCRDTINSKDQICSQINDKKDELIKNNSLAQGNVQETLKVNQSLEEGEILSEEECGKSTEIKQSKTKRVEKHTAPRRIEQRPTKQCKSLPKKNYSSNSSKPKVERKASTSSKSSIEKKTGTSSKPKAERRTSTCAKAKTKEETTVQKVDSTEKVVPPDIASVNKILDDLNLSNSIIEQLAFDIKTFPEEDLRLVHDESRTCTKQISQYDSELLNKKIAAKVYIESIDAEIEKFMTVTPFAFILDIPEGFDGKSTEPRVKILDCVTIRARRGNLSSISPLDNLYEPQMSGRYEAKPVKHKKTLRTSSERRKSVDQQTQRAAAPRQSRSKSVDQKMLLTEKAKVKSSDKEKKVKDVSQTKQKKSAVKNSTSCNVSKVSTTSMKNNTEEVALIDKRAVLDELEEPPKETRTIVEISESVVDGNMTTVESINDELMTYAICGSQRLENTEEPSSTNKQKVNEGNNSNKLPNCQELLSNLNVDVFLNKLHGE